MDESCGWVYFRDDEAGTAPTTANAFIETALRAGMPCVVVTDGPCRVELLLEGVRVTLTAPTGAFVESMTVVQESDDPQAVAAVERACKLIEDTRCWYGPLPEDWLD